MNLVAVTEELHHGREESLHFREESEGEGSLGIKSGSLPVACFRVMKGATVGNSDGKCSRFSFP